MKEKKSFSQATSYQLGIIFGCGSFITENGTKRFVARHKDRYFLEQIENLFCNNKIGFREIGNKRYYILKSSKFDYDSLIAMNYRSRNNNERYLPVLEDYKDFLRAYVELHGSWDYCTSYKKRQKYYRLRLRIFGNQSIINEINQVFRDEVGVGLKSLQGVKINNTTSYIAYTSLSELQAIRDYLYDIPYFEKYWHDVDCKISNPQIYNKEK